MIDVTLNPGRERSVRRRHPWVLSGSVAQVSGPTEQGSVPADAAPSAGWARVLAASGEVLGFGDYSSGSNLRVRLLSFGAQEPGPDYLERLLVRAVQRRTANPLLRETDAVRLVNAEGDGLPGLTVDRYADVVVVKLTSAGMLGRRELIADALQRVTGAEVGFERADSVAARREHLSARQGTLWGELPGEPILIEERGRRYLVDVTAGQKTGFYLDQRDARDLVETLAAGRRTLDLFSYTGGFAVAAARGGARSVTLVESSANALALAERNLNENGATCPVALMKSDAFRFLRGSGERGDADSAAAEDDRTFDLAIIDPPPLARSRRDVAKASRAYKDLLLFALRRAAPEALILTFACSHHVGADLFRKIAFGAALDAGRSVQVLRTLGAAVDHPVSIDHPEGDYLTGLLLQV